MPFDCNTCTPANFPINNCEGLVAVVAPASFEDTISTEPTTSCFRELPYPITTTSLSDLKSGAIDTLITARSPAAISCVL
ncbi:hypothetical protein D3C87_1714690 [compost metagenome]